MNSRGQIVEQLGMAGRVAAQSEVAGRGDQPLAEVPQPGPVDQDPGGQRILGVGDRLGHFEPAAPFLKRPAIGAGEQRRNRRGTALPGRPGLPRMKTCGSIGCPASYITMARAGAPGCVAFELFDGAVQLIEFVQFCV